MARAREFGPPAPSDLGSPLLTLWSIRDGGGGQRWRVRELRRVPEGVVGDEARTPEAIAWRFFEESDVVVVYEPGVSLIRPKEVTAGADAYYLGIARMHPEFARAARVMDRVSGRGVEVYVRRDAER